MLLSLLGLRELSSKNYKSLYSICKCRKLFALRSNYFGTTRYLKESSNEECDIDLKSFPLSSIRNFSIIAHIDHGKSTLADRILELTGAIEKDDANKQVLDKLQVEKERGITVKAQSASLVFYHNKKPYLLNLIDTPGHVDFSYEVSRALAACQGVILLVDANQGVQAQTVANFYLAFTNELFIIPVLNKIDLKNANPQEVIAQMKTMFDIDSKEVLKISAKTGLGVEELLSAVVERIPSPESVCNIDAPLRALLYDSWYDLYKGVICQVCIYDGAVSVGDDIQSFHTGKSYTVKEIAYLSPNEVSVPTLYAGQVGVIKANIRKVEETLIGDTFHKKNNPVIALPGFKKSKPMVFAGVYAMDSKDQEMLRGAIERLCLNDNSVTVTKETSEALGQGWRLGFLGLLHMDVFNTRLSQEYDAQVIVTTPSVPYKIRRIKSVEPQKKKKKKSEDEEFQMINNPVLWPNDIKIETYEPIVKGTIITPVDYITKIVRFCEERRGLQLDMYNLDNNRVVLIYKLPLNEIIVDFFDHLKSLSSGYATFDYEDNGYELSSLVKLEIKLNGQIVEEFSTIVPSSQAERRGREICLKIVQTMPKHVFVIAVQAVIGSRVVARENIKAARKDVLAKCVSNHLNYDIKPSFCPWYVQSGVTFPIENRLYGKNLHFLNDFSYFQHIAHLF